jgi:hypothetical protein
VVGKEENSPLVTDHSPLSPPLTTKTKDSVYNQKGENIMPNNTGIQSKTYGNETQILADTGNQHSNGCIVDASLGVTVENRKIAKAGTPIRMDLLNVQSPVALANATVAMNGVLLHDVDVTNGNNNGTALLFGFVNVNRLETDVQAKLTTALTNAGASKLVTFMKV